MTRIGIISDTHSYWDDKFLTYFEECDEIWHAGDICSSETMERLQAPFGNPARRRIVRAVCGRYDRNVQRALSPVGESGERGRPPGLFISGHSHILKIQRDPLLGLLHINPGAAGQQGWHMERTLVRMTIDDATMKDVEVITLADRQFEME